MMLGAFTSGTRVAVSGSEVDKPNIDTPVLGTFVEAVTRRDFKRTTLSDIVS